MTPAQTSAAQDAARVTGNEAWAIMSRMLAGMLIYGVGGWLLGRWLGFPVAGAAVGVLLGLGLGLYLSMIRIRQLGTKAPALEISGSRSWSARMTRARIERSSEV
ncbi:MAG: hypothetical protein V9E98_10055 [Candidatus Nanopelagicales bacterium]